jgi:hypothetical protein
MITANMLKNACVGPVTRGAMRNKRHSSTWPARGYKLQLSTTQHLRRLLNANMTADEKNRARSNEVFKRPLILGTVAWNRFRRPKGAMLFRCH